jgi:hypothetical protein
MSHTIYCKLRRLAATTCFPRLFAANFSDNFRLQINEERYSNWLAVLCEALFTTSSRYSSDFYRDLHPLSALYFTKFCCSSEACDYTQQSRRQASNFASILNIPRRPA